MDEAAGTGQRVTLYVYNGQGKRHGSHCHILRWYGSRVAVFWHTDQRRGYVQRADLLTLEQWNTPQRLQIEADERSAIIHAITQARKEREDRAYFRQFQRYLEQSQARFDAAQLEEADSFALEYG